MINTRFEVYKLKRELRRSGKQYDFYRNGTNEFNERSSGPSFVCSLEGIYHEQSNNVQMTPVEGGFARTKKIPMILCVMDENVKSLKTDDYVIMSQKKYRVSGVNDVSNWDLIADISLEVVDDGGNPV